MVAVLFIAAVLLSVQMIASAATGMSLRADWLAQHIGTNPTALPFSFKYSGRPCSELLPTWSRELVAAKPSGPGRQATLRMADPVTGLVIHCEVTEYPNHPAVEWVIYFENTGTNDPPILENILALDVPVEATASNSILHYAKGATCSMDDFQPLTEMMIPGVRLQLQAGGGRSSSDFLPFFNLETSRRGGLTIGLGWSGEWAAEFTQPEATRSRLQAGQAVTHLKLHPGERIRTPRVALLFYEGDWIDGQNQWRRFVLAQHRPLMNGLPLQPPLLNGNWGSTPASHHLVNIKAIANADLPVDYYWIDAEWFGSGPWWQNSGNWRVKPDLYPDGFKPLSDLLHQSGRKLLLWFEPERVCEGTPWAADLDKWLLKIPRERRVYRWEKQTFPDWVKSESLRNQIVENDRLFNLGILEARQFLTDFISELIEQDGLDYYPLSPYSKALDIWMAWQFHRPDLNEGVIQAFPPSAQPYLLI